MPDLRPAATTSHLLKLLQEGINDLVLSENSALGAGLIPALQAAGLTDKVKIGGQDGDSTTYQAVRNGPSRTRSRDTALSERCIRRLSGS